MSENVPPFVITALRGWATQTAKRNNASSAMNVADRWAEDGCWHIQITDATGTVRERTAFRANLPIVKRLGLKPS